MQMLWVDPFGLTREDTDGDFSLDIATDKIIEFFLDTATGETKVRRYTPDTDNPYNTDNATSETILLEEVNPLWEAGKNWLKEILMPEPCLPQSADPMSI